MSVFRKRLDERDEKNVSTDTLGELTESVSKNNIVNFNEKSLKQKRGTAKCALPYSILFMAELEGRILENVDNKPWGRKVKELS